MRSRKKYLRYSRRRDIIGRGLKHVYKFAPECKMHLEYKGSFNTSWRYGAGLFENTFKLKNILGVKEKPVSEYMLDYMCDQYAKYIVNRIVITFKNFSVTSRTVIYPREEGGTGYNWSDYSKYPLNENNYEVNYQNGKCGMYARLLRSHSDSDSGLSLHSSMSDNDIKIGLVDGGPYRKKGHTFYYYPRCKKAVSTGLANMPGYKDWKEILKMMGVESPIFNVGVGFGPYVGYPKKEALGVAVEVDMDNEFVMKYELTFSERKPNNLMNMSVGNFGNECMSEGSLCNNVVNVVNS